LNAIAVLLVMVALLLLGGALMLSFRLFAEIPAGPTQLRWRANVLLLGLVLLVAAATLLPPWQGLNSARQLLPPVLLLLLAGLVLLLFRDTLSLVDQVRRVAVQDRAAVTDVLTGLRPRAYLDSRMEEELSRSRRHGQAISLILMDVDDFASINKAHGHAVGDQVLMEISEILSRSLRTSDVVVRYAGEELAILATDTPPDMAGSVAERLRRDVEVGARKALREAQGARRTITVSAGVAGIDAGVKAKTDIFGCAEKALEQAKRQGKNRVVLAPAAIA
jgi:diguanylate cyclase (GGDEF)-like protein